MSIQSYRDLKVWQKAMDLVVRIYEAVAGFPVSERYGLISQTQRAAVSIPANIAEGHGRDHLGDYLHHLSIANGSLMELETHLLIAEQLEFLPPATRDELLAQTAETGRMLAGLSRSLKASRSSAVSRT